MRSWKFVGALLSVCPMERLPPSELALANSDVRRLAPNGAMQGDNGHSPSIASSWSPFFERSLLVMGTRLLDGRSEICWLTDGPRPV